MNLVAIIGNAASEPEMRYTPAGRPVATFRMAVNRPGSDTADFFTIVSWERQAEIVNKYVSKGRRVGIEGRLHHTTWETNGQRNSKIEIIANRVQLLGTKVEERQMAEVV